MDRGGYRVAEKQISGITLKDISEKMNVSMTSVHRAIYGKEGVSDKLRKQIIEVAEQMGYEPNYAASSIREKQSALRLCFLLRKNWELCTTHICGKATEAH